MTNSERLENLRAKLAASERMGEGYQQRTEAIKAEIAEIEAKN